MGLSIGHILIVLVVVLVLFGAGKLPRVMGDLGRGMRNFKDGLSGREEADKTDAPKAIKSASESVDSSDQNNKN